MFKDKVADDQIVERILARPLAGKISDGKFYISCSYFASGFLDHPLGKIERVNAFANLREKGCVLAGSTSDLENGLEMQISKRLPQHILIEITRQVLVAVIRG